MSDADTTADLRRRLRRRFNQQHFSLVEEVGNGAGFSNNGWVDALAMGIWPSRGLTLTGFEIKASRGDWQRELDKPEKNLAWQQCVDEWYVVAPKDIVKAEELPAAWGLMIPSGKDGLRIVSRSKREGEPKDVSRGMLAAVFRLARKTIDNAESNAQTKAFYTIREQVKKACADEIKKRLEAEKTLEEYAAAMGVGWYANLDEVRERAALLKSINLDQFTRTASVLRDRLQNAVKALDELVEARK